MGILADIGNAFCPSSSSGSSDSSCSSSSSSSSRYSKRSLLEQIGDTFVPEESRSNSRVYSGGSGCSSRLSRFSQPDYSLLKIEPIWEPPYFPEIKPLLLPPIKIYEPIYEPPFEPPFELPILPLRTEPDFTNILEEKRRREWDEHEEYHRRWEEEYRRAGPNGDGRG